MNNKASNQEELKANFIKVFLDFFESSKDIDLNLIKIINQYEEAIEMGKRNINNFMLVDQNILKGLKLIDANKDKDVDYMLQKDNSEIIIFNKKKIKIKYVLPFYSFIYDKNKIHFLLQRNKDTRDINNIDNINQNKINNSERKNSLNN